MTNINTFQGDVEIAGAITQADQVLYPQKRWEIDLTSDTTTARFYPIYFDTATAPAGVGEHWPINFKVFGDSLGGSDNDNEETLIGYARGGGYSDHQGFCKVHSRRYAHTGELRFQGIWEGTAAAYGFAIYMRGGYKYSILTDASTVVENKAAYTINGATFAVKDAAGSDVVGTSDHIGQLMDINDFVDTGGDSRDILATTSSFLLTTAASRLGIGTNNPQEALSVIGRCSVQNDGTYTPRFMLKSGANNTNGWRIGANVSDSVAGGFTIDREDASTPSKFMILNDGNVGIGVSDPTYNLDILDAIRIRGNYPTINFSEGTGASTQPAFRIFNDGAGQNDNNNYLAIQRNTSGTTYESVIHCNLAGVVNIPGNLTGGFTLADARIPSLAASKITSGSFADARIPNLNTSKLTAGTLSTSRGGTGTTSVTGSGNLVKSVSPTLTTPIANGANNGYFLDGYAAQAGSQFYGKPHSGRIISGMEVESTTLGGNYSQRVHFSTHQYGVWEGRAVTIHETGNTTLNRGAFGWSNQQSWSTNKTLQGPNGVYYGAQGHHWGTYSSRRFKENIRSIPDALHQVKKMRGVHFTWKHGQGDNLPPPDDYDTTHMVKQQTHIGFIAEEVEEVFPTLISYQKDGQTSGVDYSTITPVLVNAIKELDDKIGKGEGSSDDRLKDNEMYIRNATQTLMKLKPQIYDKKESLTSNIYHHEAGLIAQDIWYDTPELRFAVKPGLLSEIPVDAPIRSDDPREDPDYSKWGPNPASVDYNYLIPFVIKSIQEITTESSKEKVQVVGVTKSNLDTHRGMIVSGNNNEFSLSSVQQDKKCFGVISTSNTYSIDNEILIDRNGIGKVWVINSSNIEGGDYLTSSNVLGYAMKQDDDLLHNYTVAKSTIDCDFQPEQKIVKRIKQELSNVTYYVKTDLYEISKEEYDDMDNMYRTSSENTFYTKSQYTKVTEDGGYDKVEYTPSMPTTPRTYISVEDFNSLESNVQETYSHYYSNLSTTQVSLEDYSSLDETEKVKCQLTTKTIYSYKVREDSSDPLPGYEAEVREEYTNVLDEHGQIQWENTDETEKAYEIRYLDANGVITDEANAVHTAAFVGCMYHCG